MGGIIGLERETAKEGFKREREQWKILRNLLRLQNQGLIGRLWKWESARITSQL